MKKTILIIATTVLIYAKGNAQDAYTKQMQTMVTRLDKATAEKDYEQLANDFSRVADIEKSKWLPYYYAAFCNAKVGWLKQRTDPDQISSFADKAEQEIKKAQSLIDTATQMKQLSEIYCIEMMLNQARVFINPETYGPKYGPGAFKYLQLAKQTDPENPRMLFLLGWQKFTTPKVYGGDIPLAKKLLIKANQELTSQSSNMIEPHWGKKEVDELLYQLK